MNGRASRKRELSKRGKKPSTYRRIVTGNVKREVRRSKQRARCRLSRLGRSGTWRKVREKLLTECDCQTRYN